MRAALVNLLNVVLFLSLTGGFISLVVFTGALVRVGTLILRTKQDATDGADTAPA